MFFLQSTTIEFSTDNNNVNAVVRSLSDVNQIIDIVEVTAPQDVVDFLFEFCVCHV